MLYIVCLLSVVNSFSFWIITLGLSSNVVSASTEWSQPSLLYKMEEGQDEMDLEVIPLEPVQRHRRYVPDQVLDEYVHHMVVDQPLDNMPRNRQSKEKKFTDDKLTDSLPQTRISDNSATRTVTPNTQATTTTVAVTPQPESALNKSVIISADFVNGVPQPNPTSSDDLAISKYTDDMIERSMSQNNITVKQEDHHVYYNSTFLVDYQIGQSYWVDMSKRDDVQINTMLSKSHRRAATVKLSFDFPFYGHLVRNVTIATGGFLYTGEYVHSWLAATQYIAPLMANFDTSISNDSYIKYVDNGTAFTVQWEKVVLQDKPDSGEFTFQATLLSTGDIIFVYQSVPVFIENIQDDQHPVKVGLSDAYIIDRTIFFVRRKTIYEYHRVNFKKEDIKKWTVIYLKALPTCMEKKDCVTCVSANIGFDCKWCAEANRCSTGMDRKRQDWLHNQCDQLQLSTVDQCEQRGEIHRVPVPSAAALPETAGDVRDKSHMGSSGYLGAAFFLVLIAGIAIWAVYAYSNPHSYSGQILIRYRPSQWSWRRGEARYTAATIHM